MINKMSTMMIRTNRPLCICALLLAIGVLAGSAHAEAINLADLLAGGGEVTSGDKAFDQFAYTSTPAMPTADRVNIIPIMNGAGEHGVRIQGGFSESADPGTGTAEFDFRVRATDPTMGIDGATLASNTAAIFSADVTTTATLSNGSTLVAFDTVAGGTDLLDFDAFGIVSELNINIKIDIETFETPSAGTVSLVDLTFHQSPVPEPSTPLMMLGLVLPLLHLRRLRLR